MSEIKKETLEEAYLNKLIDEANKEFTLDRKLAKEVAIKFAEWQAETMYSEEEVIALLHKRMIYTFGDDYQETITLKWFEQFKK